MLKGLNKKLKKYSQEIQEKKKIYKIKPQKIKKMAIGTYISIITLNINGLNVPTKRHRPAEWIQKQDPYLYPLQEFHLRPKDKQTESERMEIYIPFEEIKSFSEKQTIFTTNVKETYIIKK